MAPTAAAAYGIEPEKGAVNPRAESAYPLIRDLRNAADDHDEADLAQAKRPDNNRRHRNSSATALAQRLQAGMHVGQNAGGEPVSRVVQSIRSRFAPHHLGSPSSRRTPLVLTRRMQSSWWSM